MAEITLHEVARMVQDARVEVARLVQWQTDHTTAQNDFHMREFQPTLEKLARVDSDLRAVEKELQDLRPLPARVTVLEADVRSLLTFRVKVATFASIGAILGSGITTIAIQLLTK